MSVEALNRYKRDQDRMFQETEARQRRAEALIERDRIAMRLQQFRVLEWQLRALGQLAGMSFVRAVMWAADLDREFKRRAGKL
jgi:hypothetical protein